MPAWGDEPLACGGGPPGHRRPLRIRPVTRGPGQALTTPLDSPAWNTRTHLSTHTSSHRTTAPARGRMPNRNVRPSAVEDCRARCWSTALRGRRRPFKVVMELDGFRRAQREYRDLARREDPQWRSPEAGAPTRVELGPVAVPAQAVDRGLVEANEVLERPDLAAVGVSGDLKVDAVCDGRPDLLRLVGEQQDGQVRADVGERGGMVGVVPGAPRGRRGRVVDAGDDESAAVALHDDVPVV